MVFCQVHLYNNNRFCKGTIFHLFPSSIPFLKSKQKNQVPWNRKEKKNQRGNKQENIFLNLSVRVYCLSIIAYTE